MTVHARFYGHVIRIAPDVVSRLQTLLGEFEVTTKGAVLDFAHEGACIDPEHYVQEIAAIIPPSAEAHLDFIDPLEWTMERTLIKEGRINTKRVSLNDVLERYNME
jgi:hypothetical protein